MNSQHIMAKPTCVGWGEVVRGWMRRMKVGLTAKPILHFIQNKLCVG
jgi:hypothetical protein